MESFKLLCILSLFSHALAGVEYLPFELYVTWTFPTVDRVQFEFWVPNSITNSWAWAGLGLKDKNEPDQSMAHSDLYTFFFSTASVEDRFATGNYTPWPDVKYGGTSDITTDGIRSEEGYTVYTFSRFFTTPDKAHDIDLVKGKEYGIMWAYGQSYQGGVIAHTMSNRGMDYAVLSESYVDDGSDDPVYSAEAMFNPFA